MMRPFSLVLAGATLTASAASLTPLFDTAGKGSCTGLVTETGFDYAAPGARDALFLVRLTRADCFTNSLHVQASEAATCAVTRTGDGWRLVYRGFAQGLEEATCTVRAPAGDAKLRWRIAVKPRAGWMVEETHYPRLLVKDALSADPRRDALVGGDAKGSVLRDPGSLPVGRVAFSARQPGSLAAQFVSWYGGERLFFFATEDAAGHSKMLAVERKKGGLLFSARHYGWDDSGREAGYDAVVQALAFAGRPATWYDAADLYKEWAVRQSWCRTLRKDRADLPAWLRDAPAMVRFYQADFEKPENIRRWFHGYWLKEFPGVPLVVSMWGWEHGGTWVSDYFPCKPSDEGFKALVTDFRAHDAHALPWPSGYHWTLAYDQKPDGSFAYDDRARFAREAEPHAVWKREGVRHNRVASWLKGGYTATMCGGDPWTRTWFGRDICRALAERGCEAVQADQIVGGAFAACWARHHAHPPGEGLWKTDAFRRQLVEMRAAMAEVVDQPVVCFEEPCELFNDLVGVQDYRDCNLNREWAGVFNYLYHEYVPCFQSCIYVRNRPHWYAHMAVEGQIPFFANPRADDDTDATRGSYHRFMTSWVRAYRGAGRDWLAYGRRIRPPCVTCAEEDVKEPVRKGGTTVVRRPTVHVAAYEAADGRRCLALANATTVPQEVRVRKGDTDETLVVPPDEVMLVPLPAVSGR